ncbi:MAG: dTDP-4-dehydrorhamnose 3,5-epimerase [Bacteroidetes bacterium]|jgi:dTDP-4-dehydrorhamnose 3,5-epimerase|nr:dTDP-4-dehydrorhamnose 3,5-epimerase [Bacteroidota bacterium]
MEVLATGIADLLIIQPKVFEDNRGYFFESYNKKAFEKNGINANFVQDNQSLSQKGILRGLHFQAPPHAQGKLVSVTKGSVLDIAVDIRKGSSTYGKYFSIELNERNKTMLWIPEGFAHGFLTIEDQTIFTYKCTNFYNKESEGSIIWNDPEIGIDWGVTDPVLSEKDKIGVRLNEFKTPF